MTCNRRDFFKLAGLAGAASFAPRLAFAQDSAVARSSDTLIVIYLRGGMDGLNAVAPYADANYYRLRPTVNVPRPGTAGGALDLDGFFGLHPSLAPIEPLYQSGRLAVVQAAGFRQASRSHFECQDRMERATLDLTLVSSGWLNRHLETVGIGETFQAVGMGRSVQASLRGAAPVIGLSTIGEFTIRTTSQRKGEIMNAFASIYDDASALASSSTQALEAVDQLAEASPANFPVEGGAVYPATTFASAMKEIAQLVKAGLGLQYACIDLGGWDHHDDEVNELPPLLDELSQTLAALDKDLGARMANVTVVTMTEFGRRARENASRGTDHGAGSLMMLMGGGVVGRTVYRDWPGLGDADLYNGDLDVTTDYRAVLAEILEKRMGGTDLAKTFPGYAPQPALGALLRR
ncbi:MAG TPA: DUF1501 domain-containing protein [Candidatus Saccharimonadia bacterium]|nr:DUF1501 domain-containing protein [Candidatus Saccharimonadia bacterium]